MESQYGNLTDRDGKIAAPNSKLADCDGKIAKKTIVLITMFLPATFFVYVIRSAHSLLK